MYSVIIVAAGNAKRAKLGYNKMFYKIKDKTILEYTVERFINDSDFNEIIIVLSKDEISKAQAILSNKKIKYVIGGSTRQKSVFNGLSLVNQNKVFIHDGARPNISKEIIAKLKNISRNSDAVVPYTKAKDSVIKLKNNTLLNYLDRETIGLIQTPQVFTSEMIKNAHSLALNHKGCYTDDANLYAEELNLKVTLVEGDELNIKATNQYDFKLLGELL